MVSLRQGYKGHACAFPEEDTVAVIAVLLAGGLARRMGGGDKAQVRLAGRTLLDHAIARVAPQVDALVLNANGPPERFAAYGLAVIADPLPDFPGPLAGVLAGLRYAQAVHPDVAYVVSVPTDTPFLPHDLVARLLAGAPLAVACSAGRTHPVVGLWPVALADALEAALLAGERKIDRLTAQYGVTEIPFECDPVDAFFNVNTPEELAEAERLVVDYPELLVASV